MLEVKDLYREYHPKKGTPVTALNKVSLKFPDTGMVFILGKSGSGKSTLLNVMGGLDKIDSGEIIIKGKSSINFAQSDFDSYRNTYLGFIFQEYNILDEFNVGQNIALALELQGKKATTESINNILEEVDLKGYGNRKTNELSGGQKQRVAIARALVKNPEIIFADEPTGALDSKTGIAVFDTLKKLSLTKLVVIVSHDREFAEMYADRIIELADGNVISDVEKISKESEKLNVGISVIDEKIIKIDEDYVLTDDDMNLIRTYLNKTKTERLISLDPKVNLAVKKAAYIDDNGCTAAFVNTDQGKIKNKESVFKAIKSKLSLRHCFRIGASSLKVKPFRLVLTILLSIVSFSLFGIVDTLASYEKVNSTTQSIIDYGSNELVLEKSATLPEGVPAYYRPEVRFTDEDINALEEKYNVEFSGVLKGGYIRNLSVENIDYYSYSANGIKGTSAEELKKNGFDIVEGKFPEKLNEVLITKHLYESFFKYGYLDKRSGEAILKPGMFKMSDLIGKTLEVDSYSSQYVISGIVDTKFDKTKYEFLKEPTGKTDIKSMIMSQQYREEVNYSYHSMLFVNKETEKSVSNENIFEVKQSETHIGIGSNLNYVSTFKLYSNEDKNLILANNKKTLSDNEVIVPFSMVFGGLQNGTQIEDNKISETFDELNNTRVKEILRKKGVSGDSNVVDINGFISLLSYKGIWTVPFIVNKYSDKTDDEILDKCQNLEGYFDNNEQDEDFVEFNNYYSGIIRKYVSRNIDSIIKSLPKVKAQINSFNSKGESKNEEAEYDIVGIDVSAVDFETGHYIFTKAFFEKLNIDLGKYSFVIGDMPKDTGTLKTIVVANYANDGGIIIRNPVMPGFEMINSLVQSLTKVFLWVGVGFACFASLLLFNFITISISYKKREIGILRAVGARGKDVFNIFFAESFIISMISYIFAIVITFIVSFTLNMQLVKSAGIAISLFVPGIRQIALVLAVCILVAGISTFLPVYKIAKKRPIDAIRDR